MSTWRIKSCDCDCEFQIDACNCPPATLVLECRSKTSTATLGGFSEYTYPAVGIVASVPPRKYRTKHLVGGFWMDFYRNLGATGPIDSWTRDKYYGRVHYSKDTLEIQSNAVFVTDCFGCGSGSGTFSAVALYPYNNFTGCGSFFWGALSQTVYGNTVPFTGICSSNSKYKVEDDSAKELLSDEDTEDDAMARDTAAWSAYAVPPSLPGCVASMGVRLAGQFSFTFTRVQWRITITGQQDRLYTLEVTYKRRPKGTTGPWQDYLMQPYTVSTGFDKKSITEDEVPNDTAFETAISKVEVKKYFA